MRDIIVPLDGSEFAERAIGLARTLAAALGGQMMFVQVVPRPIWIALPPDAPTLMERAAEHYLAETAQPFGGQVDTLVLTGDPAQELLALAAARPEALLVMTTHGYGGLGRVVYGSVADKVMRASTAPVTLVRADSTAPTALRRILAPLDGSPLAEAILPLVVELARATGAVVRLIRVVRPFWQSYAAYGPGAPYFIDLHADEIDTQSQAEAVAYLDDVAERLRAQGVRVELSAPLGRPADEIVQAADDADLVVLATHGRGGVRRWALGSVATETLERGVSPIMVVRPRARGSAHEQGEPG